MSQYAVRAFYMGKREGVREYAWWQNSRRYVGSGAASLERALSLIDEEEKAELIVATIEESEEARDNETKPGRAS